MHLYFNPHFDSGQDSSPFLPDLDYFDFDSKSTARVFSHDGTTLFYVQIGHEGQRSCCQHLFLKTERSAILCKESTN